MTPRRLLLGWAALLLCLGLWVVVAAALAARHLDAARDGLDRVSSSDEVELDLVRTTVEDAADHATSARGLLAQPGPALVARLPLVGAALAVERDVAQAAAALLGAADAALPHVEQLQVRDRTLDLERLRALHQVLREGSRQAGPPLRRLAAERRGVPAPLRAAARDARAVMAPARDSVDRAAALLPALEGLLGGSGPRTLAVVVMNNAELRGAGGYGGSVAVVRTDRGRIDVGAFQDPHDFEDDAADAVRVPAPEDFRRRFGPFLADTTLWKNALMSADQPSSAAVACEVLRVAPGIPCDGAVLLDVPALADLMTLTGPVVLPGGSTVDGDDLVRALLVEAYEDVPAVDEAQAARRAALRRAADRALTQLLSQDVAVADLVRVVQRAVRGRHLALWSAAEDEQRALVDAEVAGSADPDGVDLSLVAVNQLSAAKLDYYVDRQVSVSATVSPQLAEVEQSVRLTLDPPAGLPRYVLGPEGGRLQALMDIAVAPGADVQEVLRDGEPVEHGVVADSGSLRVELATVLVPGQSTEWTVRYRTPLSGGPYRLDLLPQPLARDARLTVEVRTPDGAVLEQYDGPFDGVRRVEVTPSAG